jgi:hypothetical protein
MTADRVRIELMVYVTDVEKFASALSPQPAFGAEYKADFREFLNFLISRIFTGKTVLADFMLVQLVIGFAFIKVSSYISPIL